MAPLCFDADAGVMPRWTDRGIPAVFEMDFALPYDRDAAPRAPVDAPVVAVLSAGGCAMIRKPGRGAFTHRPGQG